MRQPDLLPLLVLLVLAMLGVGGWWLFPKIEAAIARQDCIAAGHNNCDG